MSGLSERLKVWADRLSPAPDFHWTNTHEEQMRKDLLEAASLIDQQEKALEALEAEAAQEQQNAVEAEAKVDRLEKALEAADDLYDEALFHAVPESQLAVFTRAYRSARPTSTKEDG